MPVIADCRVAEMCVLSSHGDGSPNVLLEAIRAGVPVVATAVPKIVKDEVSALLVSVGQPLALVKAIARALTHKILRLIETGWRFRSPYARRILP